MRILVLQLARFGDIYQTWPTLQALKRTSPQAEIHLLVRQRFQAATLGLSGIQVHHLPAADILAPILTGQGNDAEALARLERFLAPFRALGFERIINLSFSPVSSYVVSALAGKGCEVRGYTRHADGHLNIPDDTSAFFYAQVGIGRANRFHVTELFGAVAGVDLLPDDFGPAIPEADRRGVVIHLGASNPEKCYPPELWRGVVEKYLASGSEKITLIGSAAERGLSETVAQGLESVRTLVGETDLQQVMTLLATARVLIGADSAPVHMAALTATPVLNLSCAAVNFWETGPLSPGSRVLYADDIMSISPAAVVGELDAMLQRQPPENPCLSRDSLLGTYTAHRLETEDFTWNLIRALYTDGNFPAAEGAEDLLAFRRLLELAELGLSQIERWADPTSRPVAVKILAEVDKLLIEVAGLHPRAAPVVQWFNGQRLRIPPGSESETLALTHKAFSEFALVVSVYRERTTVEQVRERAARLCRECAPELRECNMAAVSEAFQSLVTSLHELARHSTNVVGQSWSSVLETMNAALSQRDFVELADFLEWRLAPALNYAAQHPEISEPPTAVLS